MRMSFLVPVVLTLFDAGTVGPPLPSAIHHVYVALMAMRKLVLCECRNAIVFLTLYLQLLGMGDGASSALMALFLGGSALGGLVGGFLGDKAARMSPYHGRIVVCQLSVFAGVPFSYVLFKVMTHLCPAVVVS